MPFRVDWEEAARRVESGKGAFADDLHLFLLVYFWEHVDVVCQHCGERQAPPTGAFLGLRLRSPCRRCAQPMEDERWAEAIVAAYRLHGLEGVRTLLEE